MEPSEAAPLTPEEEADLQKEIERALEPYKEIAPPRLLAQMRERLEEGLRSHPVPRSLLRAFAPRPQVVATRTVARDGAVEDDEAGGGKEGA